MTQNATFGSAESAKPANRSAIEVEQCVLTLRKQLRENSPLGEHGADAILREMEQRGCQTPPSRATINGILKRYGELDGRQRKRFKTPPTGWYLKPLARKLAELDQFDYIEGGKAVQVLNMISLHGGLVGSWPMSRMTAENTVRKMIDYWTEFGLPDYAQFDNSTVFQGSRWPDSLGKVIRCCLILNVIPVFVPPRETGFQASVESYNGRWERGVWKRFHFENIKDVQRQSMEHVEVMGHWWLVPGAGAHKLVCAEVDLTKNRISFYRLRRREPNVHELIATAKYHFPNKPFKE